MIQSVGLIYNIRRKTTKAYIAPLAIIAILGATPVLADSLQVNTSVDAPPDQPLTLTTAAQYLGDSNFYEQTWDPALMALATGSADPAYRSIVDVRRFQYIQPPSSTPPLPTEEARANSAVALDEAPTPCPGGFAIRTVDSFGAVHTIRITAQSGQSASESAVDGIGALPTLRTKITALTADNYEWARQLVHLGNEIGRKREVSLPIGSGRIGFAAQLNSDRQATMGNAPLVNGSLTFTHGGGFTVALNPTPIYNNQVISRLNLNWSRPGTRTNFSLRSLEWRRAASYVDSSQIAGGAWVAGLDTVVNSRTSLSAAVSNWTGGENRGTDAMLTSQYRASAGRIYGLGFMSSAGSAGPFASYAQTLRGGGRLYLSAGAPLDDRTRVPFACRMTIPL